MNRDMRVANGAVFERLAQYCADRDEPIIGAEKVRWVHADDGSDEYLKHLVIHESIGFGRHRFLAWLERPIGVIEVGDDSGADEVAHEASHFIGLIGFDHDPDHAELPVRDCVWGFDVCLIAELPVRPNKAPIAIRDIVEAASKGDVGYIGHENDSVFSLFPSIKVLASLTPIDQTAIWAIFLRLCVDESRLGTSWIESDLADLLVVLAELNVPSLPYRELCRAVFDMDPRSLYMSLYRCIEATYAYETATKVGTALSVGRAWYEIAASLDAEMGWHPPEAQSLNGALSRAYRQDLEEICDCLGATIGKDLDVSAGKAIYKLRNQIVHYRPTNDPLNMEEMDWNRLCELLLTISLDVFDAAYG
ncbi:hypothetical protein [Cryobacterium sp. TMT2-4]|uniref:hypothetical protein n=1 Tax=Cryobacterium sp. TMT2-4 TaxID=1259254 RepID=UPI00106A27FC|nr:hypothetical protein [Cryobacterium sp. TMT2-4]TFC67790.1 hypothetical protein E3O54_08235 [Cryobacterium sp. TMT2-4]